MKKYKVVSTSFSSCGSNNTATDGEINFKISSNKRSAQEYLMNYYAERGWRFVQAVEEQIGYNYYLYFEKDI